MSFYFRHFIRNTELRLVHRATDLSFIVSLEILGTLAHPEKLKLEVGNGLHISLFNFCLCFDFYL